MDLKIYGENPECPSGPPICLADARIKRVKKEKPDKTILPEMTVYAAEHDRRRTPQEHRAAMERMGATFGPNDKLRTSKVVNPNMSKVMDALKERIGQINIMV
jgi:hypothetical protein